VAKLAKAPDINLGNREGTRKYEIATKDSVLAGSTPVF